MPYCQIEMTSAVEIVLVQYCQRETDSAVEVAQYLNFQKD